MKAFLFIIIFALSLLNCKQKRSSDPKIVLTEYYEHIKNGEFEEAKAMSDDKNKKRIEEEWEIPTKREGLEKFKEYYSKFHQSIGEPVIEGKYAIVPLYERGTDRVEHQRLERDGDTWIVLPVVLR